MEGIKPDTVKMSVSAAKWIRTLTAPPVMAILLSSALYIFLGKTAFASGLQYFEAIFTLGILPLLAYPVCALIPSFRKKGRKFERSTAIVFAVAGYIAGTVLAFVEGGTAISRVLYLTYLISGIFTGLLSFVLKYKTSGHTCGVTGPIAMLTCCLGPVCLPLILLLIPVFLASLKLGRHTVGQLIAGCAVPLAAMAAAIFITAAC